MATEIAIKIEKDIKFTIDKMEGCCEKTKLVIRLTDPYKPISKVQDLSFPAQPQYDQYLTGVSCTDANNCFNFMFGNFKTGLTCGTKYTHTDLYLKDLDAKVRRVILWYNESSAYLDGIQMFDEKNNLLLETLFAFKSKYKSKEYLLTEDERIIGFKSRKTSETNSQFQHDFQFMIGSLDYE